MTVHDDHPPSDHGEHDDADRGSPGLSSDELGAVAAGTAAPTHLVYVPRDYTKKT